MYPVNQSGIVVCPRCQQTYGEPVKFTWWGGIVGPKILHHVRCPSCRYEYNGKTGKSNQNAIILYFVVTGLIGLVIVYLLMFRR